MERALLASRSLLLPGPQPPLSHLGATLLRHVVGAGVRYGFYQLGLPVPQGPLVKLVELRLYFDATAIAEVIGDQPGGPAVTAAVIDPGGIAESTLPAAMRGAAGFHRLRLRVRGSRRPGEGSRPGTGDWASFRSTLTRWLPVLSDAFLAEVLAALARRRARAKGRDLPPASSAEAARFLAGATASLDRLGPPDLLQPSWAEAPPAGAPPATGASAVRHRARGRFRETYRRALDALRPAYLELAERAVANGLLESRDDAFFLPLDLAADLELERCPDWLEAAVAANRREYEARLTEPAPPEEMRAGERTLAATTQLVSLGGGEDQRWAPLYPLP